MTVVTVFRHAAPSLIGVLGVIPDPAFEALEKNLDWLEATGVLVERFDPYQEPARAAGFKAVTESLAREGGRCLPLILVDAEVVSTGHAPTRTELARWVGHHRDLSASL
ncbi:MAG TPA: arsenic metallochaperone ArsD family protein [Solirubrobacterales bacterium]|nr:arsenic metallochaperone ArsD family protein [Solirubrobacterales bacterium]